MTKNYQFCACYPNSLLLLCSDVTDIEVTGKRKKITFLYICFIHFFC